MSNYFINNKQKIATLFTDKNYGFTWLLAIGGVLSLYDLFSGYGALCALIFIILIIINVIGIRLQKKIYTYEYIREYYNLIDNNYKKLEDYISNNIKDDSLIADPIFLFESESSEFNTLEKLKDKHLGVITKSTIMKYLTTNSDSWSLSLNKNGLLLTSPFKISTLLFCEHSLIILSQTCVLPKCKDINITMKEVKYYQMNYEIDQNKIKIEDIMFKPFGYDSNKKIAVIIETIKPYIES